MISAKNKIFVVSNVAILSRQNILNFLFLGAPDFSNIPKFGLNLQFEFQNSDFSINITHANTEHSWLNIKILCSIFKIFDLV